MGKREKIIIATALIGALVLGFGILCSSDVPTASWGLSFGSEGSTPQGPASARQLRQLSALYVGDTTQKVIYLTFDAGYENGCTAKILDILKNHQVQAVFFLVGHYIRSNPELVCRMVQEGHLVGNHTMHHYDMSKIQDQEAFRQELEELEALFTSVTGTTMPKLYRPPQGTYSEANLRQAQNMGYHTVFWSLAYADWDNKAQPTREQAFAKLLPRIHNGAVVLLHSTSETNADILDELLGRWKEMGYRFGNISELI